MKSASFWQTSIWINILGDDESSPLLFISSRPNQRGCNISDASRSYRSQSRHKNEHEDIIHRLEIESPTVPKQVGFRRRNQRPLGGTGGGGGKVSLVAGLCEAARGGTLGGLSGGMLAVPSTCRGPGLRLLGTSGTSLSSLSPSMPLLTLRRLRVLERLLVLLAVLEVLSVFQSPRLSSVLGGNTLFLGPLS